MRAISSFSGLPIETDSMKGPNCMNLSASLTSKAARTWGNVSVAEATQQVAKQKEVQKSQWTSINESFWKEHDIKECDREIIQVLHTPFLAHTSSTLPTSSQFNN